MWTTSEEERTATDFGPRGPRPGRSMIVEATLFGEAYSSHRRADERSPSDQTADRGMKAITDNVNCGKRRARRLVKATTGHRSQLRKHPTEKTISTFLGEANAFRNGADGRSHLDRIVDHSIKIIITTTDNVRYGKQRARRLAKVVVVVYGSFHWVDLDEKRVECCRPSVPGCHRHEKSNQEEAEDVASRGRETAPATSGLRLLRRQTSDPRGVASDGRWHPMIGLHLLLHQTSDPRGVASDGRWNPLNGLHLLRHQNSDPSEVASDGQWNPAIGLHLLRNQNSDPRGVASNGPWYPTNSDLLLLRGEKKSHRGRRSNGGRIPELRSAKRHTRITTRGKDSCCRVSRSKTRSHVDSDRQRRGSIASIGALTP